MEKWQIKDSITWKAVSDGSVLLDTDSGKYYTLNETSSLIWQGIQEGKSDQEIYADFCAIYDVPKEEFYSDLSQQVDFYVSEGILKSLDV